jgi:hypothetical protein
MWLDIAAASRLEIARQAACASSPLLQIPAWLIASCGIAKASAAKRRIRLRQGPDGASAMVQ